MLLKLGLILAAIPLAFLALFAATGLLVVDVRQAEGMRLIVPVPLLLAQAALRVAPAPRNAIELPTRLRECLPALREAVKGLEEAPDGELVRIEDPRERVLITKVGDILQVRVNKIREEVSVDLPLAVAGEWLDRSRHGRVDAVDLLGALRRARFSRLAEVEDGRDHVKISIW